ncbi:MAG: 30S ribosomal protein S12 methylthiotransferase RimO [Desulfosarcinaceae bacterium]|nr:30S ribosomal protein S12 methylthiotransferase RimO [Desulfosarcinaceae bacterium]
MKVYLESLGCARNQVDSEEMLARLDAAGWQRTSAPAGADAIVVNTCCFIESAADESIETILSLAAHKKSGRCRKLVVTGCLPERYREATATELPEVDAFLGTGAFDQIAAVLADDLPSGHCLLPDPDTLPSGQIQLRASSAPHTAYLKIAEGCSRGCTYCIIPRLRGRQRSRPMPVVLAEAAHLAAGGARELSLVAQDSTAYGRDLDPPVRLAALVAALAAASPDVWIRLLYGHPLSLHDTLLAEVGRWPNICPYFDIPIQHSSSPVLRRMGRGYNREALVQLFAKIRREVPGAILRTTVIVGFPGETEADFEDLLAFVSAIRFDHLGVFTYSDAEDLPSHHLSDPVPETIAAVRYNRLMALQQEISGRCLARFDGATLPVLVEEEEEPGLWVGRTMAQAPEVDGVTYIRTDPARPAPLGAVVAVKVVDTLEYDLIGELDD